MTEQAIQKQAFAATKKATEIIDVKLKLKVDFSKKNISNRVLSLLQSHYGLATKLQHPLIKNALQDHWQQRAAMALNILSNNKLNEKTLLKTLQDTQATAEPLVKPLVSSSWLLDLQQGLLANSHVAEPTRSFRDKNQSLSYLNRLSGVSALNESDDLQLIVKQWREWANGQTVMQCAAEYRALLVLYYLQLAHPFSQSQTAVSFTVFYGLLKSAKFSHIADAILVYYAENIEKLATVFAATSNSAHLKNHQQPWFDFFIDAWEWAVESLQTSLDKLLLQSHFTACIQQYADEKKINARQHTMILQLLNNKQTCDKQSMQASAWYRSLYKNLTVRTQERDFKGLCDAGFITQIDKSSFRLMNCVD